MSPCHDVSPDPRAAPEEIAAQYVDLFFHALGVVPAARPVAPTSDDGAV